MSILNPTGSYGHQMHSHNVFQRKASAVWGFKASRASSRVLGRH